MPESKFEWQTNPVRIGPRPPLALAARGGVAAGPSQAQKSAFRLTDLVSTSRAIGGECPVRRRTPNLFRNLNP